MSGKRIINIEFDAEFHEWLSGFASAIGRPMDRTLVLLAMTGMHHYRECVKLPDRPDAYRLAVDATEPIR